MNQVNARVGNGLGVSFLRINDGTFLLQDV